MTTPLLGLSEIAEGVANQVPAHNLALRQWEARSIRALSMITMAPPAAVEGDSYIIPAGASGAWAGKTGQIASFIGGAWSYVAPIEGVRLWVSDLDAEYVYDGAAWVANGGDASADVDAGIAAHVAESDPHPQYLTATEGNAAYDAAGAATSAVSAHAGAADPHPQYLTQAEADLLYAAGGDGSTQIAAHVAAADPHTQYQKESEKGAANGYASLGSDGKVPSSQLPAAASYSVFGASGASHSSGLVPDPGATAGTTKFLREDGSWQAPGGGSSSGGATNGVTDTKPVLSNFSWVNQGTTTATQEDFGISLKAPGAGGVNNVALVVPTPAGPYTATARMRYLMRSMSYVGAGLVLSDGTKMITISYQVNSGPYLRLQRFNSPTSYSSDIGSIVLFGQQIEWMRLRDDGTNRYFEISADGKSWATIITESRTNFLTPTFIGVGVSAFQDGAGGVFYNVLMSLLSWKVE